MITVFSNSIICQELLSEIITIERGLVMFGVLVNNANGIDPDRIYTYQTEPSLIYTLRNSVKLGLNNTDWDFYINIKMVGSDTLTVVSGIVNHDTDSAGDSTFEYEWQYGDTSVAGEYEAQIHGVYLVNSKEMVFEKTNLVVREVI